MAHLTLAAGMVAAGLVDLERAQDLVLPQELIIQLLWALEGLVLEWELLHEERLAVILFFLP